MGIMVYSRLGDVLRARNMSVDDLRRQIATRVGLAVDTRTLDRMTRDERVRRPDVEIAAAAAAAALDVGLDDIFLVEAIPAGDEGTVDTDEANEEDDVLAPEQSRRLSALFDLRGQRPLTDDERAELDALVGAWGRAVSERKFAEVAHRRDIPVGQVRAEVLAETERVLAWWKDVEADPARREEVVRDAQERLSDIYRALRTALVADDLARGIALDERAERLPTLSHPSLVARVRASSSVRTGGTSLRISHSTPTARNVRTARLMLCVFAMKTRCGNAVAAPWSNKMSMPRSKSSVVTNLRALVEGCCSDPSWSLSTTVSMGFRAACPAVATMMIPPVFGVARKSCTRDAYAGYRSWPRILSYAEHIKQQTRTREYSEKTNCPRFHSLMFGKKVSLGQAETG